MAGAVARHGQEIPVEQLVEHNPQRIQILRRAGGLPRRRLGRHVRGGSGQRARLAFVRPRGDAEISELVPARRGPVDVGGFDVPVDDIQPVREDQRMQQILRQSADLRLRQLRALAHQLRQTVQPLQAQQHEPAVRRLHGEIVQNRDRAAAVGHALLHAALLVRGGQRLRVSGRDAQALDDAGSARPAAARQRPDLRGSAGVQLFAQIPLAPERLPNPLHVPASRFLIDISIESNAKNVKSRAAAGKACIK